MSATIEANSAATLGAASPVSATTTRATRRRRWSNPLLVSGAVLLGVMVAFVVVYPLVSPFNPTEPDFAAGTFLTPSWTHPLGTDNFGRDTFTRLAYGGRIDLTVATLATAITVITGTLLGLLAGYHGGWFDAVIMRLVDFMLSMPYLVLVIAIVAILGPGTLNILYAICLVGWVSYARIVRGETLVARQQEYVEAARVEGMGSWRIMWRHILPNVITTAIVFSMADLVLNILLASSLSFLGLGTQPPQPEWGLMVAEARDFFLRDWKLMTWPGLAVLVTGAALGLIGDGLAQALRPKG
ncbi:MAG TPA: ABC transporter permease [Thermomicrobiales bacterium]|nr:ABC transporter permease [Thermomicrobiales bacterium]